MFLRDEERIIPRKRINLTGLISQIVLGLFILLIIGMTVFSDQLPEFSDDVFTYITPIFIIILLVVPLGFGLFGRWVQHQSWKALAEGLGFQTQRANRFTLPTLQGTYRGQQVVISQSSQRRGRSRVYFTNYLVTMSSPSSETFEIKKRSITHLNRNKIGDEEFDKKLSTQTSSEQLFDKILRTRRLRLGIMQLGERSRTRDLALAGDTLSYMEAGQTTDTEYMRAVIGFLAELANAVERMDQMDQMY